MKNIAAIFILLLLITPYPSISSNGSDAEIILADSCEDTSESTISTADALFKSFPENSFSKEAFDLALKGMTYLQQNAVASLRKPNILTLIDFSKPSTEERLYVLDLQKGKILFKSLVAHGRNSGENMAHTFSNVPESYQSSLGFYLTAETYQGKHGFSLRLDGMEKGINDKARERAVVIHGADYVSKAFANEHGRLGRSQGCPALPQQLAEPVIKTIAGGSVLFIYAPQEKYLSQSTLLKANMPETLVAMGNYNSPK